MAVERLLSSPDIMITPVAAGTFKASLSDEFKAKPQKGDKGDKGDTGPKGDPGPAGPSGTLAYKQANGSGADYTVTDTYADLVFGAAQVDLVLPEAGTYSLLANLQFLRTANNTAELFAKFYDMLTTGDIPNTERKFGGATGDQFDTTLCLSAIHITTGATIVKVMVKKTGQAYTADADRSSSQWIQLARVVST